MNIIQVIAGELKVSDKQVNAAVELLDGGATVPFIARYRKEMTGALTDQQLRTLSARLTYLRNLEQRKAAILSSIQEQGKLTIELERSVNAAERLSELEDIYLPFKPKRRTKAMIARERGLQTLADQIRLGRLSVSVHKAAQAYTDPKKELDTVEQVLEGVTDILAEETSENPSCRSYLRQIINKEGILVTGTKNPEVSTVYDMYYEYEEKVRTIPGYRILAIDRGEKEKVLQVHLDLPDDRILNELYRLAGRRQNAYTEDVMRQAVKTAYTKMLKPSIEREVRREMSEKAQASAAKLFGENLRRLLMQPPLAGKTVLGWDPAFRTGCKLAVTDPTGKVLETAVIFPTAPTSEKKQDEARRVLGRLIRKHHVDVISVGNGTASRESEQFIADFIKSIPEDVQYVIVNEAGASVYSASELATEEFPHLNVGERSAASIARRLQDPLAELVKINPASIGVGQYQHDINQKMLAQELDGVVESCVNAVGVDLNTASVPLLSHISGINKTLAANIVRYREENGRFTDRRQLKKVPKLGPKAFEQCAGFLRILNGDNMLDMTGVHPESYPAAKKLLAAAECTNFGPNGLKTEDLRGKVGDIKKAAALLQIGEPTLLDMISELEKPGRDIRESMTGVMLRSDVMDLEDLKPGMVLKGTVRNVIDFGAFVDIGVHQDGLVHISQLTDGRFVKHPLDIVHPGDIVEVTVLQVDIAKKRISLSMRESAKNGGKK